MNAQTNTHQAISKTISYCAQACAELENAGMRSTLAWEALYAIMDNLNAKDEAARVEAVRAAKAKTANTFTVPGRDGLTCEIVPKSSIRLVGTLENTYRTDKDVDRTYRIGDTAAYGGYNLTYTGQIVSIGQKTVTIQDQNGTSRHRLTHADFSFWNRNSVERIHEQNSQWYD